jgi:glucose/arabinose dehydrogenase
VIDQPGVIWAIDLNTIDPTTKLPMRTQFLDLTDRIVTQGVCGEDTFDERGLLGLAFHPRYPTNRKFYTYTSEPDEGLPPTFASTVPASTADHQNVVAEWQLVSGGATRRELMRVSWPQFNHDGGDLAFGPDGKLYISMGDGGGADDRDGQLFTTAPPRNTPCGEAPITGHGWTATARS